MTEYLYRGASWIINKKVGAATLLSLALAFGALYGVALGFAEGIRGLDGRLAIAVVAVALMMGWALGRASSVRGRMAAALLAIGGAVFLLVSVGNLEEEIIALIGALPPLLIAVLDWLWTRGGIDLLPYWNFLWQTLSILTTRLGVLFGRLGDWLTATLSGSPALDPVGTALVWGGALWALAAWAGWRLRRHGQPLPALMPALVVLTLLRFNHSLLSPFAAVIPLGATLLLTALVHHQTREAHWQKTNVDYPEEVGREVAVIAIPLALALTLAAASLPLFPLKEINDWLNERFASPLPSFSDSDAARSTPIAFNAALAPGLPRSHLLTAGPEELKKDVALIVQVSDLAPDSPPPNFHWRSVTYDQYTGHGWRVAQNQISDYAAGVLINRTDAPSIRVVRQHVLVVNDQGGLVYVTGALLTVNQPYRAAWRSNDDLFGANVFSRDYEALSRLPVFTEDGLRRSGRLYPDRVLSRYLALPDSVPDRVLALARDLTATGRTPYDRARAIELYLRKIPYSLDVPTPPIDRDVVDFFLFDLQQGYCDYYATAMVVLARAVGLPARLVIGYAGGAYDAAEDHYIVTEADAHSWVEVYFPDYGWIEFEPTSGRPEVDRFSQSSPAIPQLPTAPAPETGTKIDLQRWVPPILWGIVGWVITIFTGWAVFDRWRLERLTPSAAAGELYRRLRRHAKRLAVPSPGGDTLFEFAGALSTRLDASAIQPVRRIINLYAQASYSPHPPTPADKREMLQSWRRLDRQLWLRWAKSWRVWQHQKTPPILDKRTVL